MNKFHILWLDDDFYAQEIDDNNGKDLSAYSKNNNIRDMRLALTEAFEKGFIVDPVRNFQEFAGKIQSGVTYHAIVFDLLGLNPNDSTDDYVMPNAWEMVKDKSVAIYVCSNTPTLPGYLQRDVRFKFLEGRVFSKRNRNSLFEKIIEDLNNNLPYYNNHEYCLEALSKGYIIGDDEHKAMDSILKNYYELGIGYCPYNDMRKVLENLFRLLLKTGDVGLPKNSVPSDIMKAVCDVGKKNSGGTIPPEYSFAKCPQEIKNTIQYIWYISNYYSHSLEKHPDYLQINETAADYNTFIQKASYQAFFVAVKWYVSRRNRINEESSQELGEILEIEEKDIRYMYSGEYQIQINPQLSPVGVGDKIIVSRRTKNKGPYQDKFPYFVYQDKYSPLD